MNFKRAKLLVAAFVTALFLFSVLLTVPLPVPGSPGEQTSHARRPESTRAPERRVAVTSIARESRVESPAEPPSADPARAAAAVAATGGATPREPELAESLTAATTTPREVADDHAPAPTEIEAPRPPEKKPETPRPLDPAEASETNPRIVEVPPVHPRAVPQAAPRPRDDPRPNEDEKTLEDDISELEKLLGSGAAAPAVSRGPRSERSEPALVEKLERLFAQGAPPARALHAASPPVQDSRPEKLPGAPPVPPAPARTVEEWRTRRQQLRALAQEEDTGRVSAMFRLEQQDPETFRSVMAQYRMDVLLEIPSRGTYSIIPHDGGYWDRTEFRKGESDLRARYGLLVRDLNLPWFGELREKHVATQLVSSETVTVALLVPKPETEILLGSIVAGCRSLGHPLEEVSACYGTFAERTLSGRRLFEYRVTRLILKDGTRVEAGRT